MKRIGTFGLALIALMMAIAVGRAEPQNPILPRLSHAKALFFQNNPAAWSQFLAQLPRRPAGPQQATPQLVSPATSGGAWTAVRAAPQTGLCNPLLLTDGTVIAQICLTGT